MRYPVSVVGSVARPESSNPRRPGRPGPADAQPSRVQEVASRTTNAVVLAVIEGAAHAINFSHPGELANVIRLFMADQPIVDDPELTRPGHRVRDPSRRTCQPRKPTDKLWSVRLEDRFGCWRGPDDQHIERNEDDGPDGRDRQPQEVEETVEYGNDDAHQVGPGLADEDEDPDGDEGRTQQQVNPSPGRCVELIDVAHPDEERVVDNAAMPVRAWASPDIINIAAAKTLTPTAIGLRCALRPRSTITAPLFERNAPEP